MARQWREYAFAARYGHQQIASLLGRQPTPLEFQLFIACLEELRQSDMPPIAGIDTED